ncbi:MAG: hypothetical protein JWO38_3442 [Gemmataceae bacterium]|nr:hypothetical protein [Gemmataceae bacterium]
MSCPRVPVGLIVLALLTVLPTGCGGGPKLVRVTGRVLYPGGRPVSAASIVFTPEGAGAGEKAAADGGTGSLMASSLLAEDGSFVLRTYPHGDGALAGRYKVTVSLGGGATTPALTRYTRLADTPLTVDVPPEGAPDLTITLK